MAHYRYLPSGWPSHFSFAVGWDPGLETYFAQVMDTSISRDDDGVVVWIGALPPHYRDIDELMRAVNDRIRGSLPAITLAPSRRARLINAMKIDYEGAAPHSTFPKSRAIAPLYLLRCPAGCPECGATTHVYALAASALYDAREDDTLDDFIVLTHIERLPRRVLKLLRTHCPTWNLDREDPQESSYLMNHCRSCGARLTDDYVHGEVGAAFSPGSPDESTNIRLFTLPADDDREILMECSWTAGLGDLLDFGEAEPLGRGFARRQTEAEPH